MASWQQPGRCRASWAAACECSCDSSRHSSAWSWGACTASAAAREQLLPVVLLLGPFTEASFPPCIEGAAGHVGLRAAGLAKNHASLHQLLFASNTSSKQQQKPDCRSCQACPAWQKSDKKRWVSACKPDLILLSSATTCHTVAHRSLA